MNILVEKALTLHYLRLIEMTVTTDLRFKLESTPKQPYHCHTKNFSSKHNKTNKENSMDVKS